MKIVRQQEAGKITLALDGRLDTTTAPSLEETLVPVFDEAVQIELDLTKLSYVSSAGLRVLLLGQKVAKSKDASMILRNVSPEVMEVLEMTGFADILTIV